MPRLFRIRDIGVVFLFLCKALPRICFSLVRLSLRLLIRCLAPDICKLAVTSNEKRVLRDRHIDDIEVQQFLVWRRSLLSVGMCLTILGIGWQIKGSIEVFTSLDVTWSVVGYAIEVARLSALGCLPLAAMLALLCWKSPRRSSSILVYGMIFTWVLPILLVAVPAHYAIDWNQTSHDTLKKIKEAFDQQAIDPQEAAAEKSTFAVATVEWLVDVVGALIYGGLLLPSIIAVFPGVLRACLRMKSLMPEAIMQGWFLLSVIPLYLLLLLLVFIASVVFFRVPQLLLGLYLLILAPLLQLISIRSLMKPWPTNYRSKSILAIGWVAMILNLLAIILLVTYLAHKELNFEGEVIRLIGWDVNASLLHYADVVFWIADYLGRSLLITVLMGDLLLRVTIALWQSSRSAPTDGGIDSFQQRLMEFDCILSRP